MYNCTMTAPLQYRCQNCMDYRWVCASHKNVAWNEGSGCYCGAEGVPCPSCNGFDPPRDPPMATVLAQVIPPGLRLS